MAIIDFSGNFSTETNEFDELKSSVDSALGNIEEALSALSSCWQDEKSVKWISDHTTSMAELKTANENQKIAADEYFAEITKILQMY